MSKDTYQEVEWSGKGSIPAVGSTVKATVNNIGESKVLKHFTEEGYIGLLVQPLDPPQWYIDHHGKDTPCHLFGTDIEN